MIRSAEPLGSLNDLPNHIMQMLVEQLFIQVIIPGLGMLRHKIMFFLIFGWMFHVKAKDGRLLAVHFMEEMMKIQAEKTARYPVKCYF